MKKNWLSSIALCLAFSLVSPAPALSAFPWVFETVSTMKFPMADVMAFGADNTGAVSANSAIDNAIASLPATGGEVYFPGGTYRIDNTIRVTKRGVKIRGAGGYRTVLNFVPAADNQIAIDMRMDPDTSMLADVGISNLRISSTDTARSGKVALRLYDVGEAKFENLWIWGWHSADNTATALVTRGREAITFDVFRVWADLPVHVMDQVNAGSVDIDHLVFRDTYFLAMDNTQTLDSPNAHVLIDNSVVIQNLIWEGSNSWVGGKHGLYYAGSSTATTSLYLSMKNIRWEGNSDATGWFAYIDHYLQTALFENCQLGTAGNGIYLRKVYQPTLVNTSYSATNVGINADNTCRNLRFINAFFQTGATATLTNLTEFYAQGFDGTAIPSNAMYGRAEKYYQRSNGVYRMSYSTGSLADNTAYTIPFFTNVAPAEAVITVVAKGASNQNVGGNVSMVTGSVSLLDNTASFGVGGGAGILSVKYTSPTVVEVVNNLGYAVNALITVEGKQ